MRDKARSSLWAALGSAFDQGAARPASSLYNALSGMRKFGLRDNSLAGMAGRAFLSGSLARPAE
jgi:hypothetical protein